MDPRTGSPVPVVAITMGDVAGIGPEVVARAVTSAEIGALCTPLVVGDPVILREACELIGRPAEIETFGERGASAFRWRHRGADVPPLACWNPTSADLRGITTGRISGAAGQAAYDWLVAATRAALAGEVDAIVTAPLNKAALHAAGHHFPGHTEILAKECGVDDFAMMLYLPARDEGRGTRDEEAPIQPLALDPRGPCGLGVAHVTLHTSIASVPGLLSVEGIREKIGLVDGFLRRLGCASPRVGVCALNPHAGESGLFGDEESRLIGPAVESARAAGIDASGPLPADTLLQRAVGGAFDGIVAMYHDQGHIALKLIGFQRAVNVTLGLPIVRTSPSHGTAFDIAGRGIADDTGLREAIRIAVKLTATQRASV